MTKFGLTDIIVIEDSIGQGRLLSDTEFGLLIDEMNVELRKTDLGVQYGFIILICLLFMDEIALLSKSAKELQEILNITSLFLNKWHLKVNIKKSAVMIFRNNIHQTYNNQFQIGTQKLNIQKQYKYLREYLTGNFTLAYHLKKKECQVEGIIQSCVFVSSDMVIANIQMESLFKLYHAVIVPAIVYSCETWIKCETDNSKLNQIQISVLRRILKLPISTPLVSIYIEILPLNLECEKCQLIYLRTVLNKTDQSNDIENMQLHEFSQNKNNLLNHITELIKKFYIPTAHTDLQNI